MTKVRRWFETPKKAMISCVCILVLLAAMGTGTVFAASAIAESNAIGEKNAQNFAFADAGVDPVSAQLERTEFDFEQGQFVYEIEFTADGTEYEYWVKASDGSIVKKELEIVNPQNGTAITAQLTLDEAKETALQDTGLSASEVTFTEAKLDRDGQLSVYELDFHTANTKYEYEINSNTGAIYSKSREVTLAAEEKTQNAQKTETAEPSAQTEIGSKQEQSTVSPQTQVTVPVPSEPKQQGSQPANNGDVQVSLETAKNTALADAGVSASDATFTKAKQDYDDGMLVYDVEFYTATHEYDYEISASTGKIISRDAEAFQTNHGNTGGSSYIGVDSAKSTALSHAGLSASSVAFSKAKLENDDGYTVYEIEFYCGGTEYDYTIDASSGRILEYDIDSEED